MNAEEVISALLTGASARRVPADPPLSAAALVAGIEVVVTKPAADRTLRKLWRERRGGGAVPLLLLSDDPARPECLSVLGVVDAAGPLRSIEAAALFDALRRLAGRPRLEAVRELSAELDRLDQAGIPGLKLRDLLTLHTLDVRLRRDPARWDRAREVTKAIGRNSDWRAVLTSLGYQLERRLQRGFLARYDGRPVAVVHPVRDPTELSRLDAEGRPPEGVLLNDCQADGAAFGVLACGGRLRLFEADPRLGSAASRYLDMDAAALQPDDLPFLALLGPEYLAEDGFEALQTEAHSFGAALRQRIDKTLRQTVVPTIALALGRWATAEGQDLSTDSTREELERAAMTLVFRALFIAYAESAGYLPTDNRAYRHASLSALAEEAAESADRLGPRSTSLWDRFMLLVKAMRTGNPAWGVPAYNGALFAADGFDGAATLERAQIVDPDFAEILVGIGRDAETGEGVDYSTLEIGHLGHIYEGLLSLHMSVADAPLVYDPNADRYTPAIDGQVADVDTGDLLWQTNEGGRKSGGVYYTRSELVRHLVRQTVAPAFETHLAHVRDRIKDAPAAAAEELFDFAVLDPACGSAHFLVVVVGELADAVVRFLGQSPLPAVRDALERLRAGASAGAVIEDVALLRRLVLKRCVFGVDVSPMGAEVAKLSLWLASFVPGLSLAYLGRNVLVGNSLIGVARPEALRVTHPDQPGMLDEAVADALAAAGDAALRVAEGEDRTPEEVKASEAADAEAAHAVAGLQRLFDLWTAEPFGVAGARQEAELHGREIIRGRNNGLVAASREEGERHHFLHWPLAFPRVFSRPLPGFDAVVGNPPWEEVTIEAQSFYALFRPGIRRGISESERAAAVELLIEERPELPARLNEAQAKVAEERAYFGSGEYVSMHGDPDLYKFFCQRYRLLLRQAGVLGVVLPRSNFVNLGSEGFRRWLYEDSTCRRVDFLLNSRLWAFDTHAQFTVALVVAERNAPGSDHQVRIAGTADSLEAWERQIASVGITLRPEAFGPGWTTPLLDNQAEATLLAKLRVGGPFPYGSGRWRCFPVAELHETMDRLLWKDATAGRPLWKGESFEQYDPHGAEARWCPDSPAVRKKVNKPRPGAGSALAAEIALPLRRQAVLDERERARVAFRDVTQKTNSRTALACLVPPEVFLTNKAPYLAFVTGGDPARAACLGIMNSLPFDWQARRFVEINLNFFILEGLVVPDLDEEGFRSVADCAARLSCVDERYADFAESFGIEPGPLPEDERQRLRVEIDARIAHAWQLSADELDVLLADFTVDAVPVAYRQELQKRLAELS